MELGGYQLKWLMRRGIAAFERQWNYDASYVHEMIEADPRAAWKFQRAASLGKYRKDMPVDALGAAAITAVRHEDCGPCTQLPGLIVNRPHGLVQTNAFEIEGNVVKAIYVVRNPDKLRHLA